MTFQTLYGGTTVLCMLYVRNGWELIKLEKMLSLYGCARTETKSLGPFTESPSTINAKNIGKIMAVKKKL